MLSQENFTKQDITLISKAILCLQFSSCQFDRQQYFCTNQSWLS